MNESSVPSFGEIAKQLGISKAACFRAYRSALRKVARHPEIVAAMRQAKRNRYASGLRASAN